MRAADAVDQRNNAQDQEYGEKNELQPEQRDIHARCGLDAEEIHNRAEGKQPDNPHTLWHARHNRMYRDGADHVDNSRRQEIVQQDTPAGEKASDLAEAAAGIGVTDPATGKALDIVM